MKFHIPQKQDGILKYEIKLNIYALSLILPRIFDLKTIKNVKSEDNYYF